jgi:hypothetical protein
VVTGARTLCYFSHRLLFFYLFLRENITGSTASMVASLPAPQLPARRAGVHKFKEIVSIAVGQRG